MLLKPGWQTSEFWGMLFKLIASLLAMFGFISYDNVQDTTNVLVNAAVALGVVFANMKTVGGYIESRKAVKMAHAQVMAASLPVATPMPDSPCICQCPCHKK